MFSYNRCFPGPWVSKVMKEAKAEVVHKLIKWPYKHSAAAPEGILETQILKMAGVA